LFSFFPEAQGGYIYCKCADFMLFQEFMQTYIHTYIMVGTITAPVRQIGKLDVFFFINLPKALCTIICWAVLILAQRFPMTLIKDQVFIGSTP
jgi:hypothetical protein